MDKEERKYVKLSELVGRTFTVEKVWGYKWQMWDNDNKKMLISNEWVKDYRKAWDVVTNQGQLTLGSGQMGTLLEAVFVPNEGGSALIGQTFQVKSNGKSGMDIRYFFNPVKQEIEDRSDNSAKDEVVLDDDYNENEPVNLSDIPF
jgi:hypothetical protein